MRFIRVPSHQPRVRNGGNRRRRRKQKRLLSAIPHTSQNHRCEIGECVYANGATHEEQGVNPDLPHHQCFENFARRDVVVFCVAAVGVEAVFDDLDFGFGEEGTFGLVDFVGEVDDEPEAEEGEGDWDEAFDYLVGR